MGYSKKMIIKVGVKGQSPSGCCTLVCVFSRNCSLLQWVVYKHVGCLNKANRRWLDKGAIEGGGIGRRVTL